nr:phosphatase PAP2 family protein [Nocardioides lijunqiniae]
MADLDKVLWLGHDPAKVLHDLLGTGFAAHLFSAVYIIWIVLVPVSIAIALVWTRHTAAGSWYVTAVAFDWAFGAAIYLMFPSVGPIYSDPKTFAGLPDTYVSKLADSMWDDRLAVVGDVVGSGTLQTIAAFASLHVGIMVTICLVVEYVGLARWLRVAAWVFLVLTVFATVYLGWHFFIDAIAGAALGAFTVWLAAMATGNRVGLRPRLRREEAREASLVAGAAPADRLNQGQDQGPAPH